MRLVVVVVVPPGGEDRAGLCQAGEHRLVQAHLPELGVEAPDEPVLLRLARRVVVSRDLALLRPAQDRHAGQLGAVVADHHRRPRPLGDRPVEFAPPAAPSEVSAISRTHLRVKSSTVEKMRNRRPQANASDTKSSDQHWLRPCGIAIARGCPALACDRRIYALGAASRDTVTGTSCG